MTKRKLALVFAILFSTCKAQSDPSFNTNKEFILTPDMTLGKLIKGDVKGERWEEFAPYRKGDDTFSLLAAGRQLAIFPKNTSTRTETVNIYDVSSGQLLVTQQIPKRTVISGPVFGNHDFYLLRTFVGASDGDKMFVANLRTGDIIRELSSGGSDNTIDTLADGRLYRIHDKTGLISISGPDGKWADIGRLAIPAGQQIGLWRINHAGNKIAVYYLWRNSATALMGDVWIANIDGSNHYRLTNQGYMTHPVWSPDDSRVAFKYDTTSNMVGGGLGGAGGTGKCSYWQVPVGAKDVSGIAYGRPHNLAKEILINMGGVAHFPVCSLVAWEKP
ncbi:hypothetical protein GCM10011613_01060 [Cellvibrio zantedeschiae]|uniref:Uncharacterized protein n=1 Tax=Cellvibrio zantedeschiae TaxID=1237077 RepID=A0ABQ3AQD9_9GAMM|nr:hypothetical protein [Cellvibrio zantedeschiae]GGY61453.1 hypothetical protein GCM10011613_01060 [Cellvibrio zantedeschiae]